MFYIIILYMHLCNIRYKKYVIFIVYLKHDPEFFFEPNFQCQIIIPIFGTLKDL